MPSFSSFKQQKLRACTPILTPVPVIVTFFVIGLIFIPVGIVLLLESHKVQEHVFRYDKECGTRKNCVVTFTLTQEMKKPVYLYYGLSNFNQNHRLYASSRQDDQLAGKSVTSANQRKKCDPTTYFNDSASESNFLFPCGLIAQSTFNDSFTLTNDKGGTIPLSMKGVAWKSDLDQLFASNIDVTGTLLTPNVPWCTDPDNCSFQNPDFVVWMRVAALPTFRKLYRVINEDLLPGEYTIGIENVFPVYQFKGEKKIIFSTASWIGGKNDFLGIAYLVTGGFSLVISIAFLVGHQFSSRKFGDVSLIEWMNVAEADAPFSD